MTLKHLIALSALAATAHTAMAHTNTTSYPLKPVLDAQLADGKVAFYFGNAAHPEVTASRGERTESVRYARKQHDDETTSCKVALRQALDSLRMYAVDHGANAVINIETSFHGTRNTSSTEFTCATSMFAAALKVRGEVVTLGPK